MSVALDKSIRQMHKCNIYGLTPFTFIVTHCNPDDCFLNKWDKCKIIFGNQI